LIKEDSDYSSRPDFVAKAVEKEIAEATLKKELSDAGKIIFEDLFRHKRYEAFREAKIITDKHYATDPFGRDQIRAYESLKNAQTDDSLIKHKEIYKNKK
jgi:hypothetical protein